MSTFASNTFAAHHYEAQTFGGALGPSTSLRDTVRLTGVLSDRDTMSGSLSSRVNLRGSIVKRVD